MMEKVRHQSRLTDIVQMSRGAETLVKYGGEYFCGKLSRPDSLIPFMLLRMGVPSLVDDTYRATQGNNLKDLDALHTYAAVANIIVDDREGIRRILQAYPQHSGRVQLHRLSEDMESVFQQRQAQCDATFASHGRKEEGILLRSIFFNDLYQLNVSERSSLVTYPDVDACQADKELEMAIYVVAGTAACLGINKIPDVYEPDQKLRQRYRWLTDSSIPLNPLQRWVKALKNQACGMQVTDDLIGRADDRELGIQTFAVYMEHAGTSEEELWQQAQDYQRRYFYQASRMGLSSAVSTTMATVEQLYAASLQQKKRYVQNRSPGFSELQTDVRYLSFREQVNASGLLYP